MGRAEAYVRLFRGRADAYGTWTGGCVHQPLTTEHFQRHVMSHYSKDWIGVYNVIGTECSWGVVDIDVPDLPTISRVRTALRRADVPSWIEQTTRGYHLWVFPAAQLVSASMMRRALMAACHQADYRPKEVFPKQTEASGTKLGNYVRLPLNGGFANPPAAACRRFVHQAATLEDMDRQRAATANLARLAAQAPDDAQAVRNSVDVNAGLEAEPIVRELGGLAYRVWRDGPAWEHDRSSTLARLAHLLFEQDVDPSTAYAIVASADDRWGKGFLDRGPSGVDILLKIIDNAYGFQPTAPAGSDGPQPAAPGVEAAG